MTQPRMVAPPFVEYLSRPEVFAQLQTNAKRYLNNETEGITNASRYFNDLPGDYAQFDPLLATLPEALHNDELDLWFDFAALVGMTDLFDRDVIIHPQIYALLNTKESGKETGPLEMLRKNYDAAKIKAYIFSSYLLFLCESAAKFIKNNLPIPDDCDATKSPDVIFFKMINERCNRIDKLDIENVTAFRITVIKMLFDETVKSKNLQREICKYSLLHPELTMGASVATHWTTMYGIHPNSLSKESRFSKIASQPVFRTNRRFGKG